MEKKESASASATGASRFYLSTALSAVLVVIVLATGRLGPSDIVIFFMGAIGLVYLRLWWSNRREVKRLVKEFEKEFEEEHRFR